jgi:hypothetical protein
MTWKIKALAAFSIVPALLATVAAQAESSRYQVVLKDHEFIPDNLVIPAGKKIELLVDKQDATPEEFESHDLNSEKIIFGNSSTVILVGPLEPGNYSFFGEFNPKTAQGTLTVK